MAWLSRPSTPLCFGANKKTWALGSSPAGLPSAQGNARTARWDTDEFRDTAVDCSLMRVIDQSRNVQLVRDGWRNIRR